MNLQTVSSRVRSAALAAAAVAAFGVTGTAQADVLYATGFSAPTYSDGGLIGQDGWLITGTSVVNPISVANTGTNGNVALVTTGQDVNRPFTPAVNSGSVFLSASITLSAAQATGDYFLHFGDGGASNFYSRIWAKSSGTGFVLAMGTSSGTGVTYGTTELAFGTTYTILARYDFVAGAANDTGALFVNPADPFGAGDTVYIAATTIGTDASVISSVNLRQGGATAAATLTIDDIVVSIIPAPGAAALLGLGGLLSARRRR